jgi:DNA-binding YbaB/EbfC family protein
MKFNMQEIMEQAQKMQQEMERIKHEADKKTVTAESGGGMVKVTVNGNNNVLEVKIAKEIVDPNDIEMLEDLIVAAFNKALQDSALMVKDEMSRVTGMVPNIPGMNFNL